MKVKEFLANSEWDVPFFKKLAHNDTGQAMGHQAGMVLPKDLRHFLPELDESTISQSVPTTDRYLTAEMYVDIGHIRDTVVRYQYQTWGGTRSAESRITDGLRPIRDNATAGDIILFQRRIDALDRFRMILIRQNTSEFAEISQWVGGRRWGALYEDEAPMTQTQLSQALTEIMSHTQEPFQVRIPHVTRVESRQLRIARSSVFREKVRSEYRMRCAVSGIIISTPNNIYEVESAHVVPVSEGGTDDIRNGFTLTQTLHWAFDRGLFGVLPSRSVYIPHRVKLMIENDFIKQFESRPIAEAMSARLRVHQDAFDWHMQNIVRQWE